MNSLYQITEGEKRLIIKEAPGGPPGPPGGGEDGTMGPPGPPGIFLIQAPDLTTALSLSAANPTNIYYVAKS